MPLRQALPRHWEGKRIFVSMVFGSIRIGMFAVFGGIQFHGENSMDWCCLGGASRIEYPGNDLAAWHVIWRMEGRVVAESNAWHPFLEWSSPLRSSDNQSGSNLRFGGLFIREFERGEMQFFWQWMEPAWTFEVKVFLQCHEAIHVGFSGQWQPRIWGLNCRVFIDGFAAHVGLAPVPLGGWRARWACSKEAVN